MFIIASFPRSGNHLVRFLTEYITGRATLGCYDNPADISLRDDTFPDPSILSHVSEDPIAIKAHWRREVGELARRHKINGIVLILRSPAEAIIAHVDRPRLDVFGFWYRRRLRAAADEYYALINWAVGSGLPLVTLRYEQLCGPDLFLFRQELTVLAEALGPAVDARRLREAMADPNRLRSQCAKPAKRVWKGYRSGLNSSYHTQRARPSVVRFVERVCRKRQRG